MEHRRDIVTGSLCDLGYKNIIEGKLSDKQGASSRKKVQSSANKLNKEIRTNTEETKVHKKVSKEL